MDSHGGRRDPDSALILEGIRLVGLALALLLSLANAWSVARLVAGLVQGTEGNNAGPLLASGGIILDRDHRPGRGPRGQHPQVAVMRTATATAARTSRPAPQAIATANPCTAAAAGPAAAWAAR
jgi:hypothetical protein